MLTWYHLVLTYDGNGRYAYYINGESWHGHNELRHRLDTKLGGVFAIGSCRPAEVNSLGGFIDEVRVYDRAITAEEARSLYRLAAGSAGLMVAQRSLQLVGQTVQVATASAQTESEPDSSPAIQTDRRGKDEDDSMDVHPVATQVIGGPVGVQSSEPYILRIGFSDQPDGEQDVTVFYLGETLHVRVADVDLASWHEAIEFSVTVHQAGSEASADVIESVLLEPDEQGIFRGEISLASFRAGTVLINLAAVDRNTDRIAFLRSAWIIIRAAP